MATTSLADKLNELKKDEKGNSTEQLVEIKKPDIYAELSNLTRTELKARFASVLDRGYVGDRLSVPLPNEVYGEWVPNDKLEIHRMQTLGFEIDKKFASNRSLHSDGTEGTSIVGDVIFMTCPAVYKELMDEVRLENYDKVNAPRRSKEEMDYENLTKQSITPAKISSQTENVDMDAIKNTLLQQS